MSLLPRQTVYVLVPTAVYDHGIVGVYATEDDARAAAAAIWPTTDGHHRFEIVVRMIGETRPDVFMRTYYAGKPCTAKPLDIEIRPEKDKT